MTTKRCAQIVLPLILALTFATAGPAQEKSVKPGINESWKSSDIEPLVNRLEAESREIFQHRSDLAAITGPLAGSAIADIGAGSGFMALEFARLTGPQGKVYAVDINPTMMENVARLARKAGIGHLETVVNGERSVELPEASVDLVFICDTYHHFEYPQDVMASVRKALRPGGQLVVVEFHRVEGESENWVLQHVRADKDVFIREIEQSGFRLTNVHEPSFLKDNYVLRFVRE